ncbi:MAG: DUF166 family protein [Promethearchaeota archaeon]
MIKKNLNQNHNIKVGVISDGKYGERAFENIKSFFNTKWIIVPDIPTNIMLDNDLDLEIPECDIYISYVRHPDIIIQIVELQKPVILGILPGIGLYKQIKDINSKVIHVPTMCSLEDNTGIPEIDEFAKFFGKPIFIPTIDENNVFTKINLIRSSLCGSSKAGANFLLNKEFNEKNLQEFAIRVCHECRAPRFGNTCDKESAGINHIIALLSCISPEILIHSNENLKSFMKDIQKEYEKRLDISRSLINEVNLT